MCSCVTITFSELKCYLFHRMNLWFTIKGGVTLCILYIIDLSQGTWCIYIMIYRIFNVSQFIDFFKLLCVSLIGLHYIVLNFQPPAQQFIISLETLPQLCVMGSLMGTLYEKLDNCLCVGGHRLRWIVCVCVCVCVCACVRACVRAERTLCLFSPPDCMDRERQ